MENTGRYNWVLFDVLSDLDFVVFVVNPIHLTRSLGLVRGKNDKVDALRIAQFAQKNHTELKPWVYEGDNLRELKLLLSERKQLVLDLSRIKIRKQESKLFQLKSYQKKLLARDRRRMKAIKTDLQEIEQDIRALIASNDDLSIMAKRVQSVPGVGPVLCWHLIAKTHAFTTLKDPRKLACFAGVAPFEHTSGSSVRRRTRVSRYADKQLKALLHMAALSAAHADPELMKYYYRKIQGGVSKMAALNAIRNKILHRVCAVIRDEKFYEPCLVKP